MPCRGKMDKNGTDPNAKLNGDRSLLSDPTQPEIHHDVVVVGAGAAGLGAAMRLDEMGIDFTVLEAQEEAGGRIRTHYYADGCLELGAQWVHGEKGNPLFKFCTENDLLTDHRVDFSVEGKGIFLLPDGGEVPSDIVEPAVGILNDVKEELANLKNRCASQCESLGFKSVGEMYRARFEAARLTGPAFDSNMRAIMDWYTKFEMVDNACEDINKLSLSGFGCYVECPGVYYINFKDGYDSFTRTVLQCLPRESVHLSTPVNHVEWSQESKALKVITRTGAVFTCNHIILTPSVGVLRNMDFRPILPSYKTNALDCFGFDTIDKVFLRWETPYWTPGFLGFQILWPEYDDDFFKRLWVSGMWVTPLGGAKVHGEFLRGIYGFEEVSHSPNHLITWIAGEEAEAMERLPDEAIIDGCYALLKRFAGKLSNVTRASEVTRSSWGSNPYVKGAYSHRVLKFDEVPDPVEKLQRPVYDSSGKTPLLLFAGEATDPDYFSTVHGALRSGYREAQRIVDFKLTQ